MNNKNIYIILSQTGTILSKILKLLTGAEYNHSSIGLNSDLKQMYSFGRLNPYNPINGGFVVESPSSGTFKRFYKTKVLIVSVCISEQDYLKIQRAINNINRHKDLYHYNYIGLFLAAFHKIHKAERRYYCSEFVRYILKCGDVKGIDLLPGIIKPIDFLSIPHKTVYCGRLQNYKI